MSKEVVLLVTSIVVMISVSKWKENSSHVETQDIVILFGDEMAHGSHTDASDELVRGARPPCGFRGVCVVTEVCVCVCLA